MNLIFRQDDYKHQKLTSEPFRFLCVLCQVQYNSICNKYQYTSSSFNTTFNFEIQGLESIIDMSDCIP